LPNEKGQDECGDCELEQKHEPILHVALDWWRRRLIDQSCRGTTALSVGVVSGLNECKVQ
jgi:hypothetical protein